MEDVAANLSPATGGLGYAFVQHYAAKGWTVFALIRQGKEDVEAKISKDGLKNVTVLVADVTDAPALAKAAEQASKITGGTLDIFVNNAAKLSQKTQYASLADLSPEVIEEELASEFKVDVIGVALATNAFLPLIRAGTTKKVITIGSGLAELELTNQLGVKAGPVYSAVKAATNMLVAKYNTQLGKSEGVLFLSISPGVVDTGNLKVETEEEQKGFQEMGAAFMAYAPHWKGPITPEESVNAMVGVVDKATVETYGGAFVSHFGDKNWL